ncbi:hypothetical protein C2U68_17845 [Methylomonas koyamae]|nr:hypothetical protein C2U68_17845 [Methylomonas koyamae]
MALGLAGNRRCAYGVRRRSFPIADDAAQAAAAMKPGLYLKPQRCRSAKSRPAASRNGAAQAILAIGSIIGRVQV